MKTYPTPIEKVVPQPPPTPVPPGQIINQVCRYFEISKADLLKRGKKGVYAIPRQVIAYRLFKESGLSLTEIGRLLNRCRWVARYSVSVVTNDLKLKAGVWQDMENMANGVEVKPKAVKVRKKPTFTALAEATKDQIFQMTRRGYSQSVIARRTGVHVKTIQKYQRLQTA